MKRQVVEREFGGTVHVWSDCAIDTIDKVPFWCATHAKMLDRCAQDASWYQAGFYEGHNLATEGGAR